MSTEPYANKPYGYWDSHGGRAAELENLKNYTRRRENLLCKLLAYDFDGDVAHPETFNVMGGLLYVDVGNSDYDLSLCDSNEGESRIAFTADELENEIEKFKRLVLILRLGQVK